MTVRVLGAYRRCGRCLMHIEADILFTVHEGAPLR